MTEQENNLSDLQRHSMIQDARISNLETKFEMFMQEMKDFRQETREQNQMRANENAEIRNDIKEIYKTTDAKIEKIENKIDSMVKHIQILTLTAMGGIIAAGVGIAAMVWSVLQK